MAELARVEFEVGHMDRALENVEQELAASDSQEQVRLTQQTVAVIILKVAHLCEGAAQLWRRVRGTAGGPKEVYSCLRPPGGP